MESNTLNNINRITHLDIFPYLATIITSFIFGIEQGILVGITVAIFELVYRGTRNRVSELGRIPRSHFWRKFETHPEALHSDRVLICRVYDSIFFTNYCPVEKAIQILINEHNSNCARDEHLLGVVINLTSCTNTDSTAAYGFKLFTQKCAKQQIALRFSNVNEKVRQILTKTGVTEKTQPQRETETLAIEYKFYEQDFTAVLDILRHHKAIANNDNAHWSRALSSATHSNTF
jgi:MFS superfamily sulfate permease-like transporter